IDDMELREEWQDEEFPRFLPLPPRGSLTLSFFLSLNPVSVVPPSTLDLCGDRHPKKRLLAPTISINLDPGTSSAKLAEHAPEDDLDFDINIDDLETPSDSESVEIPENGNEFEWEDDLPRVNRPDSGAAEAKPWEMDVMDEVDENGKMWRIFQMGEQECRVDITAIEDYKRVISYGGYYDDGTNVIIVFATCFLPESSIPNYQYIMDNLFRYIIGMLDLMVSENYLLVYLNGATPRSKIPTIGWLRQCYRTIDRRLRKNLKALMVVHPSWYIKAVMAIVRPFISAKFSKKLCFVNSLHALSQLIPLEYVHIPDCIRHCVHACIFICWDECWLVVCVVVVLRTDL
uniref:BCL2 interacting protein like n=1 Tax=Latimeria chalumnae TaxID=7897 RepID=H3AKW4_LATCH